MKKLDPKKCARIISGSFLQNVHQCALRPKKGSTFCHLHDPAAEDARSYRRDVSSEARWARHALGIYGIATYALLEEMHASKSQGVTVLQYGERIRKLLRQMKPHIEALQREAAVKKST